MTRNVGTSAHLPTVRHMSHAAPCGADVSQNAVDRDTSHRQTLYAAQEPQRKEAALDRWFALFGIVRKTSTSS